MGKKLKNYQEFPKMKNNFVENIKDEKYFYSLIEDIENSKVGFYSVGLYPASLAYNCMENQIIFSWLLGKIEIC